MIPSSYAVGDFVCSGKAVWLRIEEWNMTLAKTTLFFWLSINYASYFPIILSLSYAANPRAIVVKGDGTVYDVDKCRTIKRPITHGECMAQNWIKAG